MKTPNNPGVWELVSRPGVRNLLISSACGVSGFVTLAISMGVHVYSLSGREFDIALVGLAEFLPTFLLVLPAGALADRVDRRSLAAVGYTAEALVALAGVGYVLAGGTAVWPLTRFGEEFSPWRRFSLERQTNLVPLNPELPPNGLVYDPQSLSLVFLPW